MIKRIISFMTALSMTLMMFTTMDVTNFTVSAAGSSWTKLSAGVYYLKAEDAGANPNYATGAAKPDPMKIPYEEILAAGKTVADVKSVTATVETDGIKGCLYGKISDENVQKEWSKDAASVTFENADDFSVVEFQVFYANFGAECTVTFTLEYKDGTTPSHTHTLVEHAAVDATCTLAGSGAYWTCSDPNCGKMFSDSTGTTEITEVPTIPALGHNYVNGECTRCHESDPNYNPSHTHTGGTATCTQRAICTDCGQEYGKLLPHSENGGVMTVQPTETTAGEMTYRCTVCGTVTRTVTVPPTGEVHSHVFGTEWKYSDTRHWHECACGERTDEALHSPDGGTVTKQPTAYETGVRTYYCTVCGGFIFSETIPATGTTSAPTIPYFPPVGTVTPYVTVSNEPYLQNDSGKKGWEVISDNILSTPDGETVKVKMNGTTELPQNIVSDIKGRDIDLVLDMGGYSWTINGMSVTKAKTVDMRVRKVSKIPESTVQEFFGDTKTVQLDLRHNGDFGFIAELTVDVGNKYSGKYANSYCYKSRSFEFGDSGEIVNGKARLRFVHASRWLITIDDYPVMEDVSSGAAAHSAGTPIDMSNSTSGVTLPEFDEKKKLRLSDSKRRYRILKKRKLDDLVFVL